MRLPDGWPIQNCWPRECVISIRTCASRGSTVSGPCNPLTLPGGSMRCGVPACPTDLLVARLQSNDLRAVQRVACVVEVADGGEAIARPFQQDEIGKARF